MIIVFDTSSSPKTPSTCLYLIESTNGSSASNNVQSSTFVARYEITHFASKNNRVENEI